MPDKIKKLTVGDNGWSQRKSKNCFVQRRSLADIQVGETVLIRFKDDFETTEYRAYRLKTKCFRDKFDEAQGRYTGNFELLAGQPDLKKKGGAK